MNDEGDYVWLGGQIARLQGQVPIKTFRVRSGEYEAEYRGYLLQFFKVTSRKWEVWVDGEFVLDSLTKKQAIHDAMAWIDSQDTGPDFSVVG